MKAQLCYQSNLIRPLYAPVCKVSAVRALVREGSELGTLVVTAANAAVSKAGAEACIMRTTSCKLSHATLATLQSLL